MQMLHDAGVGLAAEERPVAVHAVTGEKAAPTLGDETRHVLVEGVGGLLGRGGGLKNCGCEARVCVGSGAPVVHLVETGLWKVNYRVEAFLVEDLEVTRGDYAEYLDDFVIVWVKTCHLKGWTCK